MGVIDVLLIEFVQALLNLALALFTVRFLQMQIDPNSEFGKALSFIFH